MSTTPEAFLDETSGVPVNQPFTRSQACARGVTDRRLAAWLTDGRLISPLRGVFHAAQLPDGPELRISCLQLVVPPSAVITGRTAGWIHRAPMILAPGDHLRVPRVEMQLTPGNRLKNALAAGGERTFLPHEIIEIEGLLITSKLRTTVDLGMGLRRFQAFAGMCAMAKVADFEHADLRHELRERGRFAGYRGVRQARELEPRVNPQFGSPAESVLGLSWDDRGGLPPYVLQHPVCGPNGLFYLDLAVPDLKYAAEYNGARWHGEDRRGADAERLGWLVAQGWIVDIFEDGDVYGAGRDPAIRLALGIERARKRFGSLAWRGQNRDGDAWLG